MKIPITAIDVGKRRCALDLGKVEALANSMSEVGLLQPVVVAPMSSQKNLNGKRERVGFRLVAGLHRIEAAKRLGWTEISAEEFGEESALLRDLAEIDENLVRCELSALELGEHLAARKEIYELLHPETRHGGDRGNQHVGGKQRDPLLAAASFVDDTAEKTGMTPTVIRDAIRVTNGLAPEMRDEVRDMPQIADRKVELAALAKLSPSEQAAVVAAVKRGEVNSVRKRKRATLRGGRALSLDNAVRIITWSVPATEIGRLIASLEATGACSVLATALKEWVEAASRVPVVLTPRAGAAKAVPWPTVKAWRRPDNDGSQPVMTEGAEPVVAKPAPESPASTEQLMEEVCDRECHVPDLHLEFVEGF
jgi:ParB family transcriptional regulator, chromosome partitioning protein